MLLTSTTVAGVKRLSASVSLCVCLSVYAIEPKRLQSRNLPQGQSITSTTCPFNIRSKGQRSRSQSAKTYLRRLGDRRELCTLPSALPLVFDTIIVYVVAAFRSTASVLASVSKTTASVSASNPGASASPRPIIIITIIYLLRRSSKTAPEQKTHITLKRKQYTKIKQ